MNVKVKICGLSTAETLEAALTGGADMVGFVFYEPSPRSLDFETASSLAQLVPDNVTKVALVVDADDNLLDGIFAAINPDMIQAHGEESPARILELKQKYQRPVIKAVKISTSDDLKTATNYKDSADCLLFDAKAPENMENALPGGNGLSFDWELIANAGLRDDFILSGGLNADNVAQAIRITNAAIVDVSSGVETRPGVKDQELIGRFIAQAKGIEA